MKGFQEDKSLVGLKDSLFDFSMGSLAGGLGFAAADAGFAFRFNGRILISVLAYFLGMVLHYGV